MVKNDFIGFKIETQVKKIFEEKCEELKIKPSVILSKFVNGVIGEYKSDVATEALITQLLVSYYANGGNNGRRKR